MNQFNSTSQLPESAKANIGFLIPFGAIIGFVLSIIAENYILGMVFAVAGILVWLLYFALMETTAPNTMGNFIILFGVLIAVSVFLSFGWERNIWGGFELKTEGSIFALLVLFFATISGVLFRQNIHSAGRAELSSAQQDLVKKAMDGTEDPRVIVLKQEAEKQEENDDDEIEEEDYYANYPYPYYVDEEDDDDEYEYVYEDEDDEYED